ncbi:hypothetical protein ACM01_45025 [Streptomyces viridochromogenes]|uniref:Uncharacterized protein n=1 Tax=Streptomyces viridochromogenes TaxID=1938 RepID=A0A0J8BMH6_STRVR|nr:hypothetical protein [Streptomyces viridochromogenes]KMS66795.1 hypothetical protein ACM01_45025 [Streptomyces viridochromogenes]
MPGRERARGGAFGELSQFFGENLGVERASISLTDGETPRLGVDGRTQASGLTFEPAYGEVSEYTFSSEQPEGAPTGRG